MKNHVVEHYCSTASPISTLDSNANIAALFRDTRLYCARQSRRDKHVQSALWPVRFHDLRGLFTGVVRYPTLPPFPYHRQLHHQHLCHDSYSEGSSDCDDEDIEDSEDHEFEMQLRSRPSGIPGTPRVISPSPTPSETPTQDGSHDSYFGPITRSATRKRQSTSARSQTPISESIDGNEDTDLELRRARTRSRSPLKSQSVVGVSRKAPGARLTKTKLARRKSLKTATVEEEEEEVGESQEENQETKPDRSPLKLENINVDNAKRNGNGHLALPTPNTGSSWNWRDFSRSPSPFGLIPIHRHFQTLIHKHEVPRKVLHVSIGLLVYWLYVTGTQPSAVTPWLMTFLVPIATTDYLRHTYPSLNRFYVQCLGAFMRESEYAGWNGVIFYLFGAWIVLYSLPKDVAIVSIMLLSWCDTAASTFGRLYGRYTPRIRKGKSLAGSLAAFLVGVATAGWFWGWLAPRNPAFPGDADNPLLFSGVLKLPGLVANALGFEQTSISGILAVSVLSVWSGLAAAGSEAMDIFGWDDNLTIPVLSGLGIWGFLKIFG